ncbi:S15/NS1 RNA-binding domain-containing protein [Cytidiella melzeri]|nr:S15/NS1 RNA-binding domain-containing protein [Cytidiella melzeri]
MLSARRLAQCSRMTASTSRVKFASIHSSAVLQAKAKSPEAKANLAKRLAREKAAGLNRPHVVLGNKPGDESKWRNCDLTKILVSEEDVRATPALPAQPEEGDVKLPTYTNFGIGESEKKMLFETLPEMSIEAHRLVLQRDLAREDAQITPNDLQEIEGYYGPLEHHKASMLARIVDLRNANAKGIAFENRRRCVEAFSEDGNPNDTGRPEVQAAILTMQIRNVWDHIHKFKHDIGSRRSLRTLVHKRAKILKYLKRKDRDRYDAVLDRLGLEPKSVEGELVI